MKAVFLLFDSLRREALECYGGDRIKTPNFNRLAEKGVTFDRHYVGSMPCMPARRDMHTGRLGFLHRSWGPLEPYDDSYAATLEDNGVYSHLVTDHYHYFEDGGACYTQRFSSYDFIRGQEKDRWNPVVEVPLEKWSGQYHDGQMTTIRDGNSFLINYANREAIRDEAQYPIAQNFRSAFDFLDRNRDADNWMLQLECYDPHEPFTAPERFREAFPTGYEGPVLDCPRYDRLKSDAPEEVEEIRANYAALVAACDEYLGRLLDYFDEHDLWKDTAIVMTADHGFLLGEHDWFGKNRMPFYNEICNIPLIVCHPDHASQGGTRRGALTQSIDTMPTLLDLFGIKAPEDALGQSILPALAEDGQGHDACLYGMFGGSLNITDGRYTFFRYPREEENNLSEYTLMPTRLRHRFDPEEFNGVELAGPMAFSKGAKVMKIPATSARNDGVLKGAPLGDAYDALYDLHADPGQTTPLQDPAAEAMMLGKLKELLDRNAAPPEYYSRFGL